MFAKSLQHLTSKQADADTTLMSLPKNYSSVNDKKKKKSEWHAILLNCTDSIKSHT